MSGVCAPHATAVATLSAGPCPKELEAHIASLSPLIEQAYAEFVRTGDTHHRAQAVDFLARRDAAILARPEAVQYARHAAFEQALAKADASHTQRGYRYGG
jgi:hypothetical protein